MNTQDVLDEFKAAGGLLEGHFILSSGLRSPVFLQKAQVFKDPKRTEKLCKALAKKIRDAVGGPVDAVVSPAMGGIIPGYETARHLGCDALFVEREDGEFQLRRGFALQPGERVVMVEDIVTTGLSSRECLDALRKTGAEILAGACLIDRSGGKADIGAPLISLAQVDFPAYREDELPEELKAIPPVKPGSRGLA